MPYPSEIIRLKECPAFVIINGTHFRWAADICGHSYFVPMGIDREPVDG